MEQTPERIVPQSLNDLNLCFVTFKIKVVCSDAEFHRNRKKKKTGLQKLKEKQKIQECINYCKFSKIRCPKTKKRVREREERRESEKKDVMPLI